MRIIKERKLAVTSLFLILGLTVTGCSLLNKSKASFKISSYKSQNEWIECPVVEIINDTNETSNYQYSFDGGETWSDKNTIISCNVNKLDIKVKDIKDKIVYEDNYTLTGTDTEKPTIDIDEEYIFSKNETIDLLSLVNVKDNVKVDSIKTSQDSIDSTMAGVYKITYNACDSSENCASKSTKIIIRENPIETTPTGPIEYAKVTSISFDQDAYDINLNTSIQINAYVYPENALDKTITWQSSDTNVVTVIDGKVYGNKVGKATITATNESVSKSAIINVISNPSTPVVKMPTSIFLSTTSLSLTSGLSSQIKATVLPNDAENKNITYKSSNSNIAKVNEEGLITAISEGSCTITVTTVNGKQGKIDVKVSDDTKISFAESTYTCNVGEKIDTTIKVSGTNINTIDNVATYGSANEAIASISKHPYLAVNCVGCEVTQISCNKAGTTTLNAKSNLGKTTNVKIVVNAIEEKISFDKTSYTCKVGQTIEATVSLPDNPNIGYGPYKTTNTNVATVGNAKNNNIKCKTTENGAIACSVISGVRSMTIPVSCNKAGATTIVVANNAGVESKAKITVTGEDDIYFSQKSFSCEVGDKIGFEITAVSSSGATVSSYKYLVADTPVASIIDDPSGLVPNCSNCIHKMLSCDKVGTTVLSATSSTGKTVSVPVTVTAKKEKIAFGQQSFTCKKGQKINTTITVSGENLKSTVASYISNNKSIATIDKHPTIVANCINCMAAQITCANVGETTLAATSSGGAKVVASIKVTE